jgi:hypothetical protein
VLASRTRIPDAGEYVVEVFEQEGDPLPPCHRFDTTPTVSDVATARERLLRDG